MTEKRMTDEKKKVLKRIIGAYSTKMSLNDLRDARKKESQNCDVCDVELELETEEKHNVLESLEESLKEMKLMREGKLKKKTWKKT
ncbi:hypothetical protein [Desulfosporosinus shakirovi]|uniref:hypothetical protein n=1 Tax=Desulfosporosinus shakirovi TaxID=2885154 RepID=UPI001E472DB4|nr:hypothetical protein [Desulfosporosinus sp. SRJS8]MCB8817357.1 hypothetical protein [Desulfosporosinus sp. SRJS8]